MLRTTLLLLSCILLLWGCQVPLDVKTLQDQNKTLQQQLDEANRNITSLNASNAQLQQTIDELERVKSVLGQEKSSRVAESTTVRGQIRQFIQSQIDNLKKFLLESDLLDYVGGELVERSNIDEKPLLVMDLYNKVPSDGSLTSVGAYFQSVGSVSVKVLRPVENEFVVVWSSDPVKVPEIGLQRLPFTVSVGVEKGDVLAYYFSDIAMVGFDTGTGNSRYIADNIAVGSTLRLSNMSGAREKRAYSIGVYGLLNMR